MYLNAIGERRSSTHEPIKSVDGVLVDGIRTPEASGDLTIEDFRLVTRMQRQQPPHGHRRESAAVSGDDRPLERLGSSMADAEVPGRCFAWLNLSPEPEP